MHGVEVMIGGARLEGTDPERLALPCSSITPPARRRNGACAHDHLHLAVNRMPRHAIDPKAAMRSPPPLIKGYLRLGVCIGDGAVIDRQFGAADVASFLPVAGINARYVNYCGPDAQAARTFRAGARPSGARLLRRSRT